MANFQDLVVSRREKVNAVVAMQEALDVMDGIMREPQVISMRGYGYTDNDTDTLREGREALDRWDAEPQTQEQRILNEKYLDQGGRAVSLAELMLRREGFDQYRSAGDDTLQGDVFNDSMQRVVERAYERYQEVTGHQRS